MTTVFLALSSQLVDARAMAIKGEPAVSLSLSQAATSLMDACGVAPTAATAFKARIWQLQRLGVPGRDPAQAGTRQSYGLVELAMLGTAIRLQAAFMTPTLAARYVVERWGQLAPFVLAGANGALPTSYVARRIIGNGVIAMIEGNALAQLGSKGQHDERYDGALGQITIVDETATDVLSATLKGAGVIIDSSAYMPTIVTRFATFTLATEAELTVELDRLRYSG